MDGFLRPASRSGSRRVRPFFGPEDPQNTSRRLLLISWHFPPANTTGALRWQRLAHFAANAGWSLDVIARAPESLERTEWSRMEELPPDTRVYGIPQRTPRWQKTLKALVGWMRRGGQLVGIGNATRRHSRHAATACGNEAALATPDPGLTPRSESRWGLLTLDGWKRAVNAWVEHTRLNPWRADAAKLACRLASAGHHRAVISCGPPHAAHDAARRVAEETSLGLALDFRDPWSLVRAVGAGQGSPLGFKLRERAERAAVQRARLVICNTEAHTIAMRAAHPASSVPFLTVRNGCDRGESVRSKRGERFVVAYAGAIYIDRDPRPLFSAASRVIREAELKPEHFGVEMMGDVETFGGISVQRLARDAGIEAYVALHPPGPRSEALDFLARASLLVSLPQSAHLSIPSKIYEYMQFEAWLLALAERGSATELLLRGSGADVVEPGDIDGIARTLRHRLSQHRTGICPPRLADDHRFSRGSEAEILLRALENQFG